MTGQIDPPAIIFQLNLSHRFQAKGFPTPSPWASLVKDRLVMEISPDATTWIFNLWKEESIKIALD